jgi:hypothetical protein
MHGAGALPSVAWVGASYRADGILTVPLRALLSLALRGGESLDIEQWW